MRPFPPDAQNSTTARAAVRVTPGMTEIQEFELPEITDDCALLKVLVAGICGTDVKMYRSEAAASPVIMGHENVGIIAAAGPRFLERKGVELGDLVFVEHYLPDFVCDWCQIGEYRHCEATDWRTNPRALRYGYSTSLTPPHLWGGFAEFMYLPWNAVLHKVPSGITPELAGLATPLSNGIEWSLNDGGVGVGSVVLIQGPGQQGLSQLVACRSAGAAQIIVTGTARDQERLQIAKELGADVTINVEDENLLERVRFETSGRGVDVAVDCTSGASAEPLMVAMDAVKRRGGQVVIQGNVDSLPHFPLGKLATKAIGLHGARGHSYQSCERALQLLRSKRYPLQLLATHTYSLDTAEDAIDAVAGLGPSGAIHVSLLPWGESTADLWEQASE